MTLQKSLKVIEKLRRIQNTTTTTTTTTTNNNNNNDNENNNNNNGDNINDNKVEEIVLPRILQYSFFSIV